jgi:hypothetical protein
MSATTTIEQASPNTALEMALEPREAQPLVVQQRDVQTQALPKASITPADLLRIAMESGDKDIERLERLMVMDERYRDSQERDRLRLAELAFHDDFAKFTSKGLVVPKSKHVQQRAKGGGPGPNYWQSEYDQVCAILKPALGECGFGVHHEPVIKRNGKLVDWIDVKCTLTHRLGHSRSITMGGLPDDSGSKNPSQEIQSTVTFWERHTLLAITSTAQQGMDNDGRGARGYREERGDPSQDAETGPLDQLRDAGSAAAKIGMAELTKWWSTLDAKQRTALTSDFGVMRKAARAVDEGGAS